MELRTTGYSDESSAGMLDEFWYRFVITSRTDVFGITQAVCQKETLFWL